MSAVTDLLDRVRSLDLERMTGLRPNYPPVALEIDRGQLVMVRVRRGRQKKLTLESHQVRTMPEEAEAGSMLRPNLAAPQEVAQRVRELFETTGTRPGRLSLILPDNLAKISLVHLPERPGSRRQLDEIVRFKVRRSVPFRLDEAALSYQVLPGDGRSVHLLVALLRRAVAEQYERKLESVGARIGLIDLCTPNLFNLCRTQIETAAAAGGDVALLNCTSSYFSLVIARGQQLIFYRCKNYAVGGEQPSAPNGSMSRELASSLSYYEEKLSGEGIGTVFVRTVAQPIDRLEEMLHGVGIGRVEPVDPAAALDLVEGVRLEPAVAHRIAPALGAAAGRI